ELLSEIRTSSVWWTQPVSINPTRQTGDGRGRPHPSAEDPPMTLLEAYARYARAGRLWPQLQGDCGVYSFYYATLLLQAMNPGKKYPLVFPRKYKSDSSKWGRQPYKTSVRQWVKSTGGLNSGQGEILTLGEMQRVISHFGYESTCAAKNNIHVRRDFISRELAAGHPVL